MFTKGKGNEENLTDSRKASERKGQQVVHEGEQVVLEKRTGSSRGSVLEVVDLFEEKKQLL